MIDSGILDAAPLDRRALPRRLHLGVRAVHVASLATTILAAMLGAPFWSDVLNKVMVIRSTVKPREKSREDR